MIQDLGQSCKDLRVGLGFHGMGYQFRRLFHGPAFHGSPPLFDFNFHRFWGLIPLAIGAWLFATRWGLIGEARGCTCESCRAQCLMGPAILVTIGIIGIIDSFHDVGVFGYAGGILLVIGAVKLFRGTASAEGHVWPPSAGPMPPVPPSAISTTSLVPTDPTAPPTNEVNRG